MAAVSRRTALQARNRDFFLSDKKVVLLSGAMHYFRIVPEYWRDRLLRVKAAGLNCVETYVPWNLHEEVKGEFNFEGILDVRSYVKLAQEVGLHVLFRPGPYICAEWEFGGLPSWLLADPNMAVRSSYPPYLEACDRYLQALLGQVADLMYSKGGPIIAVQIENEYGSYGNNDEYKNFLRQSLLKHGVTEFLFTSDNGQGIARGEVPDEQITCNFQEQEHGFLMYEYLKNRKRPGWPVMAMEFWTGWFDHWGEKHHVWPLEEFETVLTWLLEQRSSVNFYMIHGGTTFGLMNGANEGLGATNEAGVEPYAPDIGSYDYNAPIAENGELTPKFFAIRELFQKFVPDQLPKDLPPIPEPIPSKAYGAVQFTSFVTLEDLLEHVEQIHSDRPLAMEELSDLNNGGGQSFGFVLYRSVISQFNHVHITGKVKDRAILLVNEKEVGVVDWRMADSVTAVERTQEENTLDILVENCGRVNYADYTSPLLNDQRKGLRGDVLVDGRKPDSWFIYPLEFKPGFFEKLNKARAWQEGNPDQSAPCLHRGALTVQGAPEDTWIDMMGWTKGVVWVNGFNLGRHWEVGPQRTLYVPAPLLREGSNEIIVLELHRTNAFSVTLHDRPQYGDEIVHKTVIPAKERAMLATLRVALKLGSWVWRPIGYFMEK